MQIPLLRGILYANIIIERAASKKKVILGIQNIKGNNEKIMSFKIFFDVKVIFLDRMRNRSKLFAPLCKNNFNPINFAHLHNVSI
jgi:hypothetical protein